MSGKKRAIVIQTFTLSQSIRAPKIARTLVDGGYLVTFLGWSRDPETNKIERWETKDCLKEIHLGLKAPLGNKVILFYPIWWCFVFFSLMMERWDVAHVINLESILPVIIAGKLKRKPVIYDMLENREDSFSLPKVIRDVCIKVDKLFMWLASSVILADEMQADEMGGIPNSNVVAVYDSPQDIIDGIDKTRRKKDDTFILFYAGGLSSVRALNLDKAFTAIKDLEGVKLVIAGFGDLVDEIKDWSREVSEKVQYIGIISHEEVLLRTVEADLLFVFRSPRVLANKYICGSKLLETMMCGRPILVNKGTSTATKVYNENCGLVVDANNVEEIKEAIIKLRDNPELCRELGANGRRAYEERYSWDIMEQRLLALYQELTSGRT